MLSTLIPIVMLGTFAITSAVLTFFLSAKPPKENNNSRHNEPN